MWLEIVYRPTTLFSLKQSRATSSGAKTLFTPSPYAVKMALLNAIITYDSLELAKDKFDLIKGLEMSFALPEKIVVNNCFLKILKEKRSDSKINEFDTFQSTVAFREYIYFDGDIKIAVSVKDDKTTNFLKQRFPLINYFGKKGCFFQFIEFNEINNLGSEYSVRLNDIFNNLSPGIINEMDDFDKTLSFDNVNTFSPSKTKRERNYYILPIRTEQANKNFTLYSKIIFNEK